MTNRQFSQYINLAEGDPRIHSSAPEHIAVVKWLLLSQQDCFLTAQEKYDEQQASFLVEKSGDDTPLLPSIDARVDLTQLYRKIRKNNYKMDDLVKLFTKALKADIELVCSDLKAIYFDRHKVITEGEMVKPLIDTVLTTEPALDHQERCELLSTIAPMLELSQVISVLQHLDLTEVSQNKENSGYFLDLGLTLFEHATGFQQQHDELTQRVVTQLQCYSYALLCLAEENAEETEPTRATLLCQLSGRTDISAFNLPDTLQKLSSKEKDSVLQRVIGHTNSEGIKSQLEKTLDIKTTKKQELSPSRSTSSQFHHHPKPDSEPPVDSDRVNKRPSRGNGQNN